MKAKGTMNRSAAACLVFLLTVAVWAQETKTMHAEYYGEIGCSHCDVFEEKTLPEAERRTGVDVVLKSYDILGSEGYDRCRDHLKRMGFEFTIFPVLIIGENAYQGDSAIEANLLPELSFYAENGRFRPRRPVDVDGGTMEERGSGIDLSVLPVLLAGLVDGINPCAFTTLLFFLSFLSLRGGSQRRIAFVGLLFALGVFVSYFLLGLGMFNLLRAGSRFASFRLAVRVLASACAAAFCVLTIRDLWLLRRGSLSDMTLRLPDSIQRRVHSSIRGGVRSAALPAGAFVSGLVVAVLELACTGQVYFPTLSFMARTDRSWLGIGALLLYNGAFIVPLLAVLVLILAGARQDRIHDFFRRHIALSKAALAATFAVLAVLIWLF